MILNVCVPCLWLVIDLKEAGEEKTQTQDDRLLLENSEQTTAVKAACIYILSLLNS